MHEQQVTAEHCVVFVCWWRAQHDIWDWALNDIARPYVAWRGGGLRRRRCSDVKKTKFLRPRPRPPEVNKGTWRI